MNFLSRRRTEREVNPPMVKKSSRRKQNKALDSEAEISRFFAKTQDEDCQAIDSRYHRNSNGSGSRAEGRRNRQGLSPLPPVDLPERPFLGFGSCGPGHPSPIMPARSSADYIRNHEAPIHESVRTRSTSYLTWSQSGVSEQNQLDPLVQVIPSSDEFSHTRRPLTDYETDRYKPNVAGGLDDHPRTTQATCPFTRRHDTPDDGKKTSLPSLEGRSTTNTKLDRAEPAPHKTFPKHGLERKDQKAESQAYRSLDRPDTDLASLLASRNQHELLGVVLDALLGKAIQHGGIKPITPPMHDQTGKGERVPTPDVVAEPQGSSTIHDSNINPKLAEQQPPTSGSRPLTDTLPANSVATDSLPPLEPVPSPMAHTQLPKPQADVLKALRQEDMQQAPQQAYTTEAIIPQSTQYRPISDNAWTGYRNLYESQLDEAMKDQNGADTEAIGHTDHERYFSGAPFAQGLQSHSLLSQYNENRAFDTEALPNSRFGEEHVWEPEFDLARHHEPQIYQAPNVEPEPSEKVWVNVEPALDESLPSKANHSLSTQDENAPLDHNWSPERGTPYHRQPSAFLGGRGFLITPPNDLLSPSHAGFRPVSQGVNGGIVTQINLAEVGKGDRDATLSGFWRPNRLY
ncbi:MAG: hypothetical protein Q9222_003425 [Ikaeria aurantiellina]